MDQGKNLALPHHTRLEDGEPHGDLQGLLDKPMPASEEGKESTGNTQGKESTGNTQLHILVFTAYAHFSLTPAMLSAIPKKHFESLKIMGPLTSPQFHAIVHSTCILRFLKVCPMPLHF